MFSRGIRGISVENNISAVAVKEKDFFSSSLTRQLFSSGEHVPCALLATPAGEAVILSSSHKPTELSKLTVCGVCMNTIGARIYKKFSTAGINIIFTSFCDIAASFIIRSDDCECAIKLIRDNFTLEL